MKKILFVCTGNSCRSVMAQGLLQHRLKQLEHRLREPVEVSSAGIFAIDGMSPSRETLKLLQHVGVDLSAHMARNLSNDMIREAAQVFVMEPFQRDEIIRRMPEAKEKVHLLKVFGRPETDNIDEAGIPDPIGKPREVYEVCFNHIKEAVERVAQSLIADNS